MVERCTRTQLAYASVEENTLQNRLTDEDMRGEYIHLPGGWTPTQSSNPALYRSLRHAWHWHTLLDVGADALAQYKLFLLDQPDLDGDIVDADTRLTYLRGSDSVWLQGAEDMLEIAAKQAAVLVEHDDDGAMEPLLAGAHAEQFPLFQLMRLTARVGPGARPASVAHCDASDPAVCSDVQRCIAVRREVDDLFKQAVPLGNTVPRDELKDLVPDAELSLPAFNVVTGSYDPRSLKSTLMEFMTMRDTDAQAVRPVFDAATGESARMRLTVSTVEGEVFPIEVDGEEPVEHVMAILEPVTGLPLASQVLLFNGRPLDAGAKLKDAGLKDDDLLLLMPRQAAGAGTGAGAGPSAGAGATSSNPMGIAQDGSAVNPTAMMDAIQGNSQLMDNLAQSQPELMEAIRTRNVDAFQKALRASAESKRKAEAERQQEMQRLMNDPLNPESQARMMEMINQENVQQAYENAMEYNPELFGSVIMLYVDMEVNGTVMKAFVDSGAQSTIMSQKCAERLGIMRLCDKRFHGIAKGVGTSKIVGRVHQAPIKVGNSHLTASITILEQDDMEFLFGLDMLKRHQCCIDLNKNELRFGSCNESLRFLSEHELPSAARQFSEAPPTPSKPPGAEAAAVPPPAPAATAPAPAAAAAAAAAARAAGAAAPAAPGGADPAKVQQLVGLGFTSVQAIQALNACGGDVDQAAAVLFGGF
eukprot:jgi/Tetstr1/456402/TSEL_043136.t1